MKMRSSQSLRSLYLMPAVSVWLGLSITACSPSQSPKMTEKNSTARSTEENQEVTSAPIVKENSGKKLTELSGQATLPYDNSIAPQPVPEHAKKFIGRFHAYVKCDDSFIPCKEGEAEFILNLLPDGTVHRSIVQFGKVFAEKTINPENNMKYRKDTWSINQAHNELVVHRKEGINFYYDIIDDDQLVMNIEKIRQGEAEADRNQELFSQGYPQPQKAYKLTRYNR